MRDQRASGFAVDLGHLITPIDIDAVVTPDTTTRSRGRTVRVTGSADRIEKASSPALPNFDFFPSENQVLAFRALERCDRGGTPIALEVRAAIWRPRHDPLPGGA
jgi:hypothetical protein